MGGIHDILAHKGTQVHAVQKSATAFEALREMVERNVGSLLVLNGESVAGIFTERDYVRRVALPERPPRSTRVEEVMTPCPITLDVGQSIEECMTVMTLQRIRHLPVLDSGRLAGLVSIGDLVKHLSAEKEVEVRHLTEYISGKYPA